jgi:processive 1,2-diacylglycerol beta-glucosyltransferase
MSVDLVVVHSPVGGGHKAAANAVLEAARNRGLDAVGLDAFEHAPKWAGDAYLAAHLTGQNAAPALYGYMYENANRKGGVLEPLRLQLDNLVFGTLRSHVRALAPRAVVATHHLPLVVLGRARLECAIDAPLLGVVTDYTTHACWAEHGVDAWAVPCARAGAELAAHGAPRERIVTTGIPVREGFEWIAPLRVDAGRPLRVVVTSGGFGAASMVRIVESFASFPDIELTVVCGRAPRLEDRVRRAAARCGVRARVIGFEHDMPARLAEADAVVGKAGGLTVTETMTAGRPMVIASAVPGNEKLNQDWVVDAGAGVATAPDAVGSVIARLRAEDALEPMGRRARALVTRGAARRVMEAALRLAFAPKLLERHSKLRYGT